MIKVKVIKNDILEAEEKIIVHQVNCFTMGSGVAKAIYTKFPNVKAEHKSLCEKYKDKREELLGKIQLIDCTPKIVCNLFGQFEYGNDGKQYTIYKHLYYGLETIFQYAKLNELDIAIPYKIGCERGGADWDKVHSKINELAYRYSMTDNVKLYKYVPKSTNNKHFK